MLFEMYLRHLTILEYIFCFYILYQQYFEFGYFECYKYYFQISKNSLLQNLEICCIFLKNQR